jgi:hypothetical protein
MGGEKEKYIGYDRGQEVNEIFQMPIKEDQPD